MLIDNFVADIVATINDYRPHRCAARANFLRYAEIIGALELIKADLIEEMRTIKENDCEDCSEDQE